MCQYSLNYNLWPCNIWNRIKIFTQNEMCTSETLLIYHTCKIRKNYFIVVNSNYTKELYRMFYKKKLIIIIIRYLLIYFQAVFAALESFKFFYRLQFDQRCKLCLCGTCDCEIVQYMSILECRFEHSSKSRKRKTYNKSA